MRVGLFVSSVACLALLVAHAWRETLGAEWRPHQLAYKRVLSALAENDAQQATAADFEVKPRQAVLADGAATDRCISCHVALEDPRMADQAQPLRTHPGDYLDTHPPERFGCTLCHDGQGLALTTADAAAYERGRFWEKPLIGAPFIEANCYRCHSEPLAQTPTYEFGKQIFDGSGCIGCHTVRGRGGTVGPDLTFVGDSSRHVKVPTASHHDLVARFRGNETIAYLFESVQWPNAQPTETKMPTFGLTDEEATALVVYLKSLVRRPTVASLVPPVRPPLPVTDPVQRGAVLYGRYCIGCHAEGGKGGIANPNAIRPVIGPINTMAAKMAFSGDDQVEQFLTLVRGLGARTLSSSDATKLPNWPAIEQVMQATRQVVRDGSSVPAVAAGSSEPLGMPAWGHLINADQVDTILYYLLTTMPWSEAAPAQERRQ
jgi:mono/diheme cytochrome c family protein